MKSQSLINDAALQLIKSFEGIVDGDPRTVNLDPYLDPVGIWTIGWGRALVNPVTGQFVRDRNVARSMYPRGITRLQAETLLREDVAKHTRELDGLLNVELNENQYGALASLIFNIGGRNLQKSTLIKLVNAEQFEKAADQFLKWTKAGGRTLPGLVRRRAAERKLFLTPLLVAMQPAESVADQAESPVLVDGETSEPDVDLLGAAVNSANIKRAGKHLGPRIAKHSSAALSFAMGLYEAHKIAMVLVVLVLLAGLAWITYHNRKHLTPLLLKISK